MPIDDDEALPGLPQAGPGRKGVEVTRSQTDTGGVVEATSGEFLYTLADRD